MSSKDSGSSRDHWSDLPRRVLIGFLIADAFFCVMYAVVAGFFHTSLYPLYFLFDLNGEGNIQAWYSGVQLLLIGLAFFALSSWVFQSDERVSPLHRLFFVSGIAFTYLSADEVGQIHEHVSAILQRIHFIDAGESALLAAVGIHKHLKGGSIWIPLFAVVGIALIVWLWPQLMLALKLWRREVLWLAAGFAVVVLGGVVLESVGDLLPAYAVIKYVEIAVEETFEMVGASIMIFAVTSVVSKVAARLLPPAATGPHDAEAAGHLSDN